MSEFQTLGDKSVTIEGRFRLDVICDKKKFSLTNINSFVPYGKTASSRIKFQTESGEVESLFIDRASVLFDPQKAIDRHNISVLIQHDEVKIGNFSEEENLKLVNMGLKKPRPRFILTNVDKVENEKYEDDVSLLRIRAKLFDEKSNISKEKLIWICSNFGIPYKSDITDYKKHKQDLVKKVDKFITSSLENAKRFDDAISQMKKTEMRFYINELLNIGIIEEFGGIYKISDRPIGSGIDHVMSYYEQNNNIYLEHQKMVKEALGNVIK